MNIIIMGAGEVGKGLAIRLVKEGHNVEIIDINPSVRTELETHVDVKLIEGNGASISVLESADIHQADMFIGVSDNDERNMIACSLAKQSGVGTTIARVRSEEYIFPDRTKYTESMKIDLLINPDEVSSQELFDLLENPVATSVADFSSGRLKLVGFPITSESPLCNRPLSDLPTLGFEGQFLVAALVRNEIASIPRGDTKIQLDDELFVIAAPSALNLINEMGGKDTRSMKRVILVGASRVSFFLAERLEKTDASVILIDKDEERCNQFAKDLTTTRILHGDGRDITVLDEAGIKDVDGFISASQDDETNILSALLAKQKGAKRVISLMRKPQYIPLMSHIKPIDVALNPRLVTIHAIMRYVREGKILTMASLANDMAEAIEMEVVEGSRAVGRKLKEGIIPRDILLGAIVRGNNVIIPRGEDSLEPGDRVVLIVLKQSLKKVDDLMLDGTKSNGLQRLFQSISKTVLP
jgi:trk system potassium uptake protein TrkA